MIDLPGDFQIRADDAQFILFEKTKNKEGVTTDNWKPVAYFARLEAAVNRVYDILVRRKVATKKLQSVRELADECVRIRAELLSAVDRKLDFDTTFADEVSMKIKKDKKKVL